MTGFSRVGEICVCVRVTNLLCNLADPRRGAVRKVRPSGAPAHWRLHALIGGYTCGEDKRLCFATTFREADASDGIWSLHFMYVRLNSVDQRISNPLCLLLSFKLRAQMLKIDFGLYVMIRRTTTTTTVIISIMIRIRINEENYVSSSSFLR